MARRARADGRSSCPLNLLQPSPGCVLRRARGLSNSQSAVHHCRKIVRPVATQAARARSSPLRPRGRFPLLLLATARKLRSLATSSFLLVSSSGARERVNERASERASPTVVQWYRFLFREQVPARRVQRVVSCVGGASLAGFSVGRARFGREIASGVCASRVSCVIRCVVQRFIREIQVRSVLTIMIVNYFSRAYTMDPRTFSTRKKNLSWFNQIGTNRTEN